jgi:two-component system CheB/CheR fusion protein
MVEVLPIHTIAPRARSYLLLFVPEAEHLSRDVPYESIAPGEETTGSENLASRLGQDLAATRLYLQTLLEERDAKNQELVSANEEIQSSNEEMQSTNEELETTKEELQSSNEELQTVNEELHQRNTALQQTSNDLTNLLNSVNLPVLMLSNDLHIRHFTPPAQRLMNLRAPDIGRPFAEMRLNLEVDNLEHLFADVLDTLTSREIEVQDKDGRWYLLRVRPYRTMDNKIDGVVVVLLDIDQLRRSQQDMLGARDFARSVIEGVPLPLAVVDLDLRIRAVNDAFRKLANIAANEDLDRRGLLEVAALAWSLQEPLVNYLEPLRSAPDISRTVGFEYRVQGESGKTLSVSARPLKPDGEVFLLVTIEDISARKEIERLSDVERDRLAGEAASTARELGRTQDELRALAGSLFTSQEEERRRVARELHDDIGQKLAAIEIDCKRTDDQMTPASAKAVEGLANVRAALRDLAEDVRRISHGLHPSAIEDLGLGVALRALVDDFREHSEMIVDFRTSELPKISPMVAIELYRIAQEGLRNVAKHAGNTHVRVSLRPHGAGIRLQIVDAGEGFDVASRRSGLGIISMEERAREMGAKLTLESKPGEGTRLIVDAPVNEERESPKP